MEERKYPLDTTLLVATEYYTNQPIDQAEGFKRARDNLLESIATQGVRKSCYIIAEYLEPEDIEGLIEVAHDKQRNSLAHAQLPLPVMLQNNRIGLIDDKNNKRGFVDLALETGLNAYQSPMQFSKWLNGELVNPDIMNNTNEDLLLHTYTERAAISVYSAFIIMGLHIPEIQEYRYLAEEGGRLYRENFNYYSGVKLPENHTSIEL